MDCSPPGSSVHGISQARQLGVVAISSSRGPSRLRDWTHVSCTGSFFTAEPPGKAALWIWRNPKCCRDRWRCQASSIPPGHPNSRCHWVWDSTENLRRKDSFVNFLFHRVSAFSLLLTSEDSFFVHHLIHSTFAPAVWLFQFKVIYLSYYQKQK